MAIVILLIIALGITIFSALYIWYMNRQWWGRPQDPQNLPPAKPDADPPAPPR
jgi:hypothetical protein